MKPSELYVGLAVVVTPSDDATVYVIESISGFSVILKDRNASYVSDSSLLRLPTIIQMMNK
jgi:hypothetical protein